MHFLAPVNHLLTRDETQTAASTCFLHILLCNASKHAISERRRPPSWACGRGGARAQENKLGSSSLWSLCVAVAGDLPAVDHALDRRRRDQSGAQTDCQIGHQTSAVKPLAIPSEPTRLAAKMGDYLRPHRASITDHVPARKVRNAVTATTTELQYAEEQVGRAANSAHARSAACCA